VRLVALFVALEVGLAPATVPVVQALLWLWVADVIWLQLNRLALGLRSAARSQAPIGDVPPCLFVWLPKSERVGFTVPRTTPAFAE